MTEPIILDLAAYTATRDGQRLALPLAGFRILAALAAQPGRIVAHADLYRLAWQAEPAGAWLGALNMNIVRLRKAMGDDGSRLCAVRSVGYLLVEGAAELRPRPRGEQRALDTAARLDQAHEVLAAIAGELSPTGRIGQALSNGSVPAAEAARLELLERVAALGEVRLG
ncbi:winged helix-turn-helix domain-containing protein [Nonomuraea sp. bgisy101]|uniref:winged helix-turn-helix domain-containing protein n=1 Tax=Nonomuraea sp. bgisy101 TaxID=3413784 RepID=UPI003D76001C